MFASLMFIFSLVSCSCFCRIAEAKLFLHRFVHEQANLQLLFVKREKLLVLFNRIYSLGVGCGIGYVTIYLAHAKKSSTIERRDTGVSNVEVEYFATSICTTCKRCSC